MRRFLIVFIAASLWRGAPEAESANMNSWGELTLIRGQVAGLFETPLTLDLGNALEVGLGLDDVFVPGMMPFEDRVETQPVDASR